MQILSFTLLAVVCLLLLPGDFVWAADQATTQDRVQTTTQERIRAQDRDQEQVYGSQLMTWQEREEYHNRMRAAKSAEEQERIRNEHHERMQERAKAQGLSLPDMPPPRGAGMGPGGRGMGPGSGGMGGGMSGGGMGSGGKGSGGSGHR